MAEAASRADLVTIAQRLDGPWNPGVPAQGWPARLGKALAEARLTMARVPTARPCISCARRMARRRAALARLVWPTEGPTSSVLDRARRIDRTVGPRQADVLSEVEASVSVGTTTGAIARALDCAQPDTDITLSALSNQGLVEQDTSVHPHVYRLSPALAGGAADGTGASEMTEGDTAGRG